MLVHSYCADDPIWGQLSNPGFENQSIKSIFFFAGNWRNGVQFYDYNPSDNRGLFTLHPADARHLGWSENIANRNFALNKMIDAGANLVNMSYWGLPGTDNWAYWSPMQTSTASHDELFNAALGKDILIAPYIESFAATDDYDGFTFADDFPGTAGDPSPLLVSFIEDLVDRYLINPDNTQWPEKWARVYDQDGQERYLISIIHVASNQGSVTDQSFSEGFDHVADAVFVSTGIHVGFALDILPPDNYAPGSFKATPTATGTWLAQQSSVIAIQCFIPEIWEGSSNETDLINWRNTYQTSWKATGIPFIHDISPGYDAHIVFPTSPVYGNNQNWLDLQSQAITNFESTSFTFNAWNGYTEGFAGIPTAQYGDNTYNWLCGIYGGTCGNSTSVESQTATNDNLEVFPIPANNIITIMLYDNDASILSMNLVNISGIAIDLLDFVSINRNTKHIQISTTRISNGMYYLNLITSEGNYCKKIMILK